jgi:hypothetical protein
MHSESLKTETLRVTHMQVVGAAVCKFEHLGFKRTKERETTQTWGQKTLRARVGGEEKGGG